MRTLTDPITASGHGRWELFRNGAIIDQGFFSNVITAYGQRMYWERGASVPNYPSAPTGMRLGSGTTTPAFSGVAAAIDQYLSGSARALSAPPASAMPAASRQVTYQCVWPVGVATGTIAEAVITNENPLTDIPGIDANTISRVVFEVPIVKNSLDGFLVVWHHTLGS